MIASHVPRVNFAHDMAPTDTLRTTHRMQDLAIMQHSVPSLSTSSLAHLVSMTITVNLNSGQIVQDVQPVKLAR